MSNCTQCPACHSYSSGVFTAFAQGNPCPECGLPADAATAIERARNHHVATETVERLAAAELRVAELEHENIQLHHQLADIIDAAKRKRTTLTEDARAGLI